MSIPTLNIKLPRPVTSLHQIEITSRCNLRCVYCTSPNLKRPKIDMTEETFRRALEWVAYYRKAGTQGELNLAGIGESTMHPQFIDFIKLAREAVGIENKMIIATNGLTFTEEIARAAAEVDLRVCVSMHRPEKAALAIALAKRYGVLEGVSADPSMNPNDWAGQVDFEPARISPPKAFACPWMRGGWIFVLADGQISRCCLDSDGSGVFTAYGPHSGDYPITVYCHPSDLAFGTSPWKLCATCYQDINIVGYEQRPKNHLPVIG